MAEQISRDQTQNNQGFVETKAKRKMTIMEIAHADAEKFIIQMKTDVGHLPIGYNVPINILAEYSQNAFK